MSSHSHYSRILSLLLSIFYPSNIHKHKYNIELYSDNISFYLCCLASVTYLGLYVQIKR